MASDTTYIRPLQYDNGLRLMSVILGAEVCSLVGSGFDDDAQVFVSVDDKLEQLAVRSVTREASDIIVADPITFTPPFSVFVVNPSTDGGQASNAIVFQYGNANAVADVVVNGASVVKNNVAVINMTSMLVTTDMANMIYGTDANGKQTVYDIASLKGVQQIQVGGIAVPISDGVVNLANIAKDSEVLHLSSSQNSMYATDDNGNQTMIAISTLAKQTDLDTLNKAVSVLQTNYAKKQDKDSSAADGDLAVFSNGQTVSSNQKLSDLNTSVSKNASDIETLNANLTDYANRKVDWKAVDETSITNSPLSASGIAMTTYALAKESALAAANKQFVNILAGTDSNTSNSTAVGSNITASGSVAFGSGVNASNGTAIGDNASATDSVAIGKDAAASQNSVAIGNESKTTDPLQVSFGDASTSLRRRLSNVNDPSDDFDAVNKHYIDTLSGNMAIAVDGVTIKGSGKANDPIRSIIGTSVGTFVLARSPFKVREVRTESGQTIYTSWLGIENASQSQGFIDNKLSTEYDAHYVYTIYLNTPENDTNQFLNAESAQCIWGRIELTEKAPGFIEYDIVQDEDGNERHVAKTSSIGGYSGYKHSIALGDDSIAMKENELSIGRGLESYEVDATTPFATAWTGAANASASTLTVQYQVI